MFLMHELEKDFVTQLGICITQYNLKSFLNWQRLFFRAIFLSNQTSLFIICSSTMYFRRQYHKLWHLLLQSLPKDVILGCQWPPQWGIPAGYVTAMCQNMMKILLWYHRAFVLGAWNLFTKHVYKNGLKTQTRNLVNFVILIIKWPQSLNHSQK